MNSINVTDLINQKTIDWLIPIARRISGRYGIFEITPPADYLGLTEFPKLECLLVNKDNELDVRFLINTPSKIENKLDEYDSNGKPFTKESDEEYPTLVNITPVHKLAETRLYGEFQIGYGEYIEPSKTVVKTAFFGQIESVHNVEAKTYRTLNVGEILEKLINLIIEKKYLPEKLTKDLIPYYHRNLRNFDLHIEKF